MTNCQGQVRMCALNRDLYLRSDFWVSCIFMKKRTKRSNTHGLSELGFSEISTEPQL